jgi:hypothetical protein
MSYPPGTVTNFKVGHSVSLDLGDTKYFRLAEKFWFRLGCALPDGRLYLEYVTNIFTIHDLEEEYHIQMELKSK